MLRGLLDFVLDILPAGVRAFVERGTFIWLLICNIAIGSALFAACGADAKTITEFGPFVALVAASIAVAETDLVQRWTGGETRSTPLGWVVMVSVAGFALAVGLWMHADRTGAERHAAE